MLALLCATPCPFEVPKNDTDAFYFLCVLAFAAGFSERWAQDTLTAG